MLNPYPSSWHWYWAICYGTAVDNTLVAISAKHRHIPLHIGYNEHCWPILYNCDWETFELCLLRHIVRTSLRFEWLWISIIIFDLLLFFSNFSISQLFRTADKMYSIPFYRATIYVAGIAVGYILRVHKNSRLTKVWKTRKSQPMSTI